jgi:hypothetical protein
MDRCRYGSQTELVLGEIVQLWSCGGFSISLGTDGVPGAIRRHQLTEVNDFCESTDCL